jgi:DNA helicase HerA-like ATPase
MSLLSPANRPLLLGGAPKRRLIRRPDFRHLVTPRLSGEVLGASEVDYDDLVILRSWRAFEPDRPAEVRYFMFEVAQRNPGESAPWVGFKAVRFARLSRVPRWLRQQGAGVGRPAFTQMQYVLSALREQGVLFVQLVTKTPDTPLIFAYGVQALGPTPEYAQAAADGAYASLCGLLDGTFQQIEYESITTEEGERIARQQATWNEVAVARGRPVLNTQAIGAAAILDGNRTDIEQSHNQMEAFIRGMSETRKGFMLTLVSVPLAVDDMTLAVANIASHLSVVRSETRGMRSFTAGVALPLMVGNNNAATEGDTHTRTDSSGTGTSDSSSLSTADSETYSVADGVSSSTAYGESQSTSLGTSESLSDGVSASDTTGESLTDTTGTSDSVSEGTSESLAEGTSSSTSASSTTGTTDTVGGSVSNSGTVSSSTSESSSSTAGSSSSSGWSSGSSSGASLVNTDSSSSGTNVTGGILGFGGGASSGEGSGVSMGVVATDSWGASGGSSSMASSTTGSSTSSGVSLTNTNTLSASSATSNSTTQGTTEGTSLTSTSGTSLTNTAGTSASSAVGSSTSATQGTTQTATQGTSATATQGTSLTNTQGTSSTTTQGTGTTVTTGSTSGTSTNQAVADAYAVALSRQAGSSGSLGVVPSFGVTVSKETLDAGKQLVGDILEETMRRYVDGAEGGAYLYQMFLVTEDRDTLLAGAALLKSSFWGPGTETHRLSQPFHTLTEFVPAASDGDDGAAERERLRVHAAAFSSYRRREPTMEIIEPFAYSSYVTCGELATFARPPVAESLGLLAVHDSSPVLAMPGDRNDREITLGRIFNGERGVPSHMNFGLDANEMTHTLITGVTGSGKTTTLMRLLSELVRVERTVVDPGGGMSLPKRLNVGASVLALDWMRNMRHLGSLVEPVRVDPATGERTGRFQFFSVRDPQLGAFRWNPLAVPGEMDPVEWLNATADNMVASWNLGEFGRALIAEYIDRLYGANRLEPFVLRPERRDEMGNLVRSAITLEPLDPASLPADAFGTDASSGEVVANVYSYAPLSRLVGVEHLAVLVASAMEEAATVEGGRQGTSLRDRLQSLWRRVSYFAPQGQLASLISCDASLAERSCLTIDDLVDPDAGLVSVIETDGLDMANRRFILGSVMLALYRSGLLRGEGCFNHGGRGPGLFVVLEEAHELFGEQGADDDRFSASTRTALYESLHRRIRALGAVLIDVVQNPGDVPEAVTSNTSTVLVHRTYAEADRKRVFSLLNWSNILGQQLREYRYLGEMPVGQCIARLHARHSFLESAPVLFVTEPAAFGRVTDAHLSAWAAARGATAPPPPPPPPPNPFAAPHPPPTAPPSPGPSTAFLGADPSVAGPAPESPPPPPPSPGSPATAVAAPAEVPPAEAEAAGDIGDDLAVGGGFGADEFADDAFADDDEFGF